MKITALTAQNLNDPLGLECPRPGLSWQLRSGLKGDFQHAFRILAASRPELLTEGKADLWDSGKVEERRNYAAVYGGMPLASRQGVYWKVRVWDSREEASDWSETAYFEMGLLEPEDWKGSWIGRGDDFSGDKSMAPALAKRFPVKDIGGVRRARLYISGLGLFCASVNGQAVTQALFEPGESEFEKRVYYVVYDILPFLREGENALGVILGNGQYANYAVSPVMKLGDGTLSEKHRYQKDDTVYLRDGICGDVKLLAQIELVRADGRVETAAVSDESWRWTESAVTFQNWYGGEDYDGLRALELAGWDCPEPEERSRTDVGRCPEECEGRLSGSAGWRQAAVMEPPKGRLCAKEFPPVQIWETWQAESVVLLPNGHWLVDLGKNSAGFVRLKLNGTEKYAGTRIRMYPAEVLKSDGSGVDQASCTQSCDTLFQCRVMDSYVCAGTGREEWHPRFCYHGFQYVEVEGFPGTPSAENFEGCAVRMMNEKVSDFETDDAIINRINQITDRSIESNMMFSFTDCPQIEKLGWLETTQLMFSSMAAGYDIRAWIPKIMADMRDAQVKKGAGEEKGIRKDREKYPGADFSRLIGEETEGEGFVPGIAPEYFRIGRLYKDPNWGGACVMTPWYYYLEYGDRRILEENYPMMKGYVSHLENVSDNGVLKDYAHMGEWGQLHEETPTTLVATCAFFLITNTMIRIAEILERREDAEGYEGLAERIRSGFYQDGECFRKESGIYGNGSQASFGCVLFSGIVRPEERRKALDGLLQAVAAKGDHLTSGEVGLKQVFCALAENGENDVVYRMVMNPTEPSYRHHVDHGLTTLPEFWNYTELWNGLGRSRNHAMMGHVKEWLCRFMLGIAPVTPGYDTFRIRPWLQEEMKRVRGSIFTVHGTVRAECEKLEKGVRMAVQIPVGAKADVWIPCPGEGTFACREEGSGQRAEAVREGDHLKISAVPSGSYVWIVE